MNTTIKKTLGICAVAAMLLQMAACQVVNTGTGASTEGASITVPESCETDGALIAVLLPNRTNPYYVSMTQGFEDAAKAAGMKAEVQIAEDDDAKQLSQAEAVLQKKPCAVALNPVKSEPAAATVRKANEVGVPVFDVNMPVDDKAMKAQGASIVQYLGADNKQGGRQVAKMVLEDMGADAKLNIGLVAEPDEVSAVTRDDGFKDEISSNKNAKVVAEVDGNVKITDSLNATADMLQGNPDLNVIFSSTGPGAQGALEAVKASGKDVKVYGFCAAELTLTDAYPGCVAQEPYDYAHRVVAQIVKFKEDGKVDKEILRPLKSFKNGETPAAGEVG